MAGAKLTQDLIDDALMDIQTMLHKLGQSLEFHKMRVPAPRTIEQEADKYREVHDELNYNHNELEVSLQPRLAKLTLEQWDAYLDICTTVENNHHRVFFLDAPGTLCDLFSKYPLHLKIHNLWYFFKQFVFFLNNFCHIFSWDGQNVSAQLLLGLCSFTWLDCIGGECIRRVVYSVARWPNRAFTIQNSHWPA